MPTLSNIDSRNNPSPQTRPHAKDFALPPEEGLRETPTEGFNTVAVLPDRSFQSRARNFDQCNRHASDTPLTRYVFFQAENNTDVTYEISTQYILGYLKKLQKAIDQEPGIKRVSNPYGLCGWTIDDKVYNKGVIVGYVEHQTDAPSGSFDRNVTAAARRILQNNYPSLEIGLAVGIPVAVAALLLSVYICCGLRRH